MAHHARTQADALADVERQIILAVEEIDARPFRQTFEHAFRQAGRTAWRLHGLDDGGIEHVALELAGNQACKLVERLGVAHRAVAGSAHEAMAFDQRIEPVTVVLGKQRPRELDGAQHRRVERLADAAEFVLDETVIEARVVGDENAIVEKRTDAVRQLGKSWRIGDHCVGNADQGLDIRWNRPARIDQAGPAFDKLTVFDPQDRDFGDPIDHRIGAGGFNVDKGEFRG